MDLQLMHEEFEGSTTHMEYQVSNHTIIEEQAPTKTTKKATAQKPVKQRRGVQGVRGGLGGGARKCTGE